MGMPFPMPMGMSSLSQMNLMGQAGGLMPPFQQDMIMNSTGMATFGVPPRSGRKPVSNMDFWMFEARRQRLESRYNSLRDFIVKETIEEDKEGRLKSIALDALRFMCRQEAQLFRLSRVRYQ